jgi:hypothetical protein
MKALLERIGAGGLVALALVLATAAFHRAVQEPLERKLLILESALRADRSPAVSRTSPVGSQMEAFYSYFAQPLAAHEWLAKLHGIARVSGIELPAAEYRKLPGDTRLMRYQLALPIRASYGQARAFMANALNEIPILSVDEARFRRASAGDPRLEVDLVMTLHVLEP